MEKENNSANELDLILIVGSSKQMRIVGEGGKNRIFNPQKSQGKELAERYISLTLREDL